MESNLWNGFKDEVEFWIENFANEEDERYYDLTDFDIKEIVFNVINNEYLIQEMNETIRDKIREYFCKKYDK